MQYEPIIIKADNLSEAWEKAVREIMKNGFERMVYAPEFQCKTKDSPMFITVSNPLKESRLHEKAPMTREAAEEYAKNMIYGMGKSKENEFDYSYFSRLRYYPDCLVRASLPNMTETEEELSNEVQRISGGRCIVQRIDQVKNAIEIFKKDPTRRSVVLQTWIPMRDLEKFALGRKATSSPCLVIIHPQIVEEKLHFNVVMKTNDLFNAWPGNAFAFTELQKYMAEQIGIGVGHYNHFAVSMHIYEDLYEQARLV